MATKAKSKSKAKKTASKTKKEKSAHLIGHNSGGNINKPLMDKIDQLIKLDDDKKQIGKHQRDIKASIKDEFGFDKEVVSHEIKMRKLDSGRRAQFEQNHADLKDAIGYQMALALLEGEDGEDGEGNDADNTGESEDGVTYTGNPDEEDPNSEAA
jgi:uncharacterized protein (UPF0335 family)